MTITDDICKRLAEVSIKAAGGDEVLEIDTYGNVLNPRVDAAARALADAGVREAVEQLEILANEDRVHMPPQARSHRAGLALAALRGQDSSP